MKITNINVPQIPFLKLGFMPPTYPKHQNKTPVKELLIRENEYEKTVQEKTNPLLEGRLSF